MEKIKKENAVQSYFDRVIVTSWTWQKMTEHEKDKFQYVVLPFVKSYAKGKIEERENMLFTAYYAYLCGIGHNGPNWRCDGEIETF